MRRLDVAREAVVLAEMTLAEIRERYNEVFGEGCRSRHKASCAVHTRKSTEEGFEQEFNTLDAQRDAGAVFFQSQRAEGWGCLPERHGDSGDAGGFMDRLIRFLLDFVRIVETPEKHGFLHLRKVAARKAKLVSQSRQRRSRS